MTEMKKTLKAKEIIQDKTTRVHDCGLHAKRQGYGQVRTVAQVPEIAKLADNAPTLEVSKDIGRVR